MVDPDWLANEINTNPEVELQHWRDALVGLEKQRDEYAVKPSTEKNKKFYSKILDEITKTKEWIRTLEG